ncbi:hypothetical protein ASZ90_016189 [hydrocarbon metagenome]|uniref:Uncharacterized protein n=1 Tax=hydrocarbon metagenome TaxID=938273 RepID=A0A0W8EZW8_9ZZZZ
MEFRPESPERTKKPDMNPGFRGENVKHLYPDEDPVFISGFVKRVKEFNSVPTKKEAVYADSVPGEHRLGEKGNA